MVLGFLGVAEEVQCVEYQETEGDSVLQRHPPYPGLALQGTAHQEQH